MLTRTVQLKRFGKYERIGLNSEEMDNVMNELLKHNMREMQRIIDELKNRDIPNTERELYMLILGERNLMSSFTVVTNALDEKIFRLRSEARGEKKEDKGKVKNMVQQGFRNKNKENGQSMVDKAFETSV